LKDLIEIILYLPYATPILLIIGLVVGLTVYPRLDALYKSVLYYLLLMLLVDLTGRILSRTTGTNVILLPVYSLIELCFFFYFYKKHLLRTRHNVVTALGYAGIIYITGEIAYYFILNTFDIKQFQPYAKVVDNFVVILFSLAFFHEKINRFRDSRWDNFTLNIVLLIFFTLNLIFFLPFNFLINEKTGLKFYFWLGNLIITLVFYIYLICLIWSNGRPGSKVKQRIV